MIKLLVVDDNEQGRYLLQTLLTGYGYEVILAADGVEALEKARNTPPDMVITDILMPGMDGYVLCRQWKHDPKLKDIPLVFYTATYTDPRDEDLALSLGAVRFIVKPQEPDVFVRILREVIEECQAGRLPPAREPVIDETVYLKEYNEALIRKLENKLVELESAKVRLELEVAQRTRSEEALRFSEKKHRQLHESMMDAYVSVNMDGRLQEFNQAYMDMLGYDREELLSRTYLDLTPEKWHAFEADIVEKQLLQRGYSDIYEKEYRRKDGAAFPVELRTVLLRDETGTPVTMWAVVRDITTRTRMEDELRSLNADLELRVEERTSALAHTNEQLLAEIRERKEAENELAEALHLNRTLVASSSLGVLAYAYSGRCLLANDAAARIVGDPPPVLMKQNFRELEAWRRDGRFALADSVLAGDGAISAELHSVTSSGKEVWINCHVAPFVSRGEKCVLVVMEDITSRVRAEHTIEEQRVNMANAARLSALGVMAGGIAHEVNNPLAAISIATESMERLLKLPGIDRDQTHRFCETILRNTTRASKIIHSLRELSRESGGDPFSDTSVANIVNGVLDLCQERFSVRGIELIVSEIPEELCIQCNAPQLSQVVLNILNNAYDAVEDLAERWVRVEVQDSGDAVRVSFTDSGHGLSAKAKANLFVPFFTTKEVGKGTGLGLSISRKIIEGHGGNITMDSECPNTRFVLHIPKRRAASAP